MRVTAALLLLAALPGLACDHERSAANAPHPLAALRFPLFSTDVVGRCDELRRAREEAGRPRSVRPAAIDWAPSLAAAFARATREDKPVLLATFVRENADPLLDV